METAIEPALESQKRALLQRMARVGLPEFQIAFTIGVSADTLQIFYGDLLQEARIGVNLLVLETLERLARSGKSVSATIFWVHSRCGWSTHTAASKKFIDDEPLRSRPEFGMIVRGPNGEVIL
jgi:hypothetical protein